MQSFSSFQEGQTVKILTDSGRFSNSGRFNRQSQIGKILTVDEDSVQVNFETPLGDYDSYNAWFDFGEVEIQNKTNLQRQEEIQKLELEIESLNTKIVNLKKEIKDNPEKIKAEAGDTVKFTYGSLGERLMFIMQKEQGIIFDPEVAYYEGDFVFVGLDDSRNSICSVNNGSWVKLELKKKATNEWIDSKEVDWSGVLK